MGRPRKEKEPDFNGVVPDKSTVTLEAEVDTTPQMHERGWNDYVMGKFDPQELWNGYPTVDGLRRVVEEVLGPVIVSESKVVQPPNYIVHDGKLVMHGDLPLIVPAVVEHYISIGWKADEYIGPSLHNGAYRQFKDVGEVNTFNTPNEAYLRHATSVAATKAEGRALRKALKIRKPCAEEMHDETVPPERKMEVPLNVADDSVFSHIDKVGEAEKVELPVLATEGLKRFIEWGCTRYNLDIVKYLQTWNTAYNSLEAVTQEDAVKMEKHLSGLQQRKDDIPEGVKNV